MRPRMTLLALVLACGCLAGCGRPAPAAESLPAAEPAAASTPEPAAAPTPQPTSEPTPEPTPEPSPDMSLLPSDWFNDAVFLGDSVSMTLDAYNDTSGDLGEPLFLCTRSFSVRNAINTYMTVWFRGQEWDALNVIPQTGGKKLFIMLGINDIGGGLDQSMADWEVLLGGIRARDHRITIFVQSLLPMFKDSESPLLNNKIIDEYNQRLKALCVRTGCIYVDVAGYFKDEDGSMRQELTGDYYVHPNNDGAALWAALLRDPANYSVDPRSIDYEKAYY